MNKDQAAALRKAFPPATIGKLPKGGVMLDYVGHAATTDRLLQVDPEWTWEPLSVDEAGLPAMDAAGNLWIRLTVAGVTRIGVGDGKNMKERIGDAIRNAAMRFGVALDLWAKEDLHAMGEERGDQAPANHDSDAAELIEQERAGNVAPKTRRMGLAVTPAQLSKMHACFNDLGVETREQRLEYTNLVLHRDKDHAVASSKELTKAEAAKLIDAIESDLAAGGPGSLAEPPEEAS